VVGIHLIPPLAGPDPATFGELTEAERAALDSLRHSADWDSGYSAEHATWPQTIGYRLYRRCVPGKCRSYPLESN
jgi:hypothetical protein